MIILDENIFADQRDLLQDRHITSRQIGVDLEKKGLSDEEIVTLLHQLARPTFFSRDQDFFDRRFCHARYCIVWLDVKPVEVAEYAWRFLRHARFRSRKQRLGTVARVSPRGIVFWRQKKKERRDW